MRRARPARPRPEGGAGAGARGEGAATLINGSKVELSPQPVFVLGLARPAGQEITERESGFIGVAASDDGGGGREGERRRRPSVGGDFTRRKLGPFIYCCVNRKRHSWQSHSLKLTGSDSDRAFA